MLTERDAIRQADRLGYVHHPPSTVSTIKRTPVVATLAVAAEYNPLMINNQQPQRTIQQTTNIPPMITKH